MSTTTETKKSPNGGSSPVTNGEPSLSVRTSSTDSSQMPRRVWWSPTRRRVEIRTESVKYTNAKPRVDSLTNMKYKPGGGHVALRDEPVKWQASSRVNSLSNISWSAPIPHVSIRQEKLKWNAQPKVNSLGNVNYKPSSGVVEIHDEKLDFGHVTPRIDCGLIH